MTNPIAFPRRAHGSLIAPWLLLAWAGACTFDSSPDPIVADDPNLEGTDSSRIPGTEGDSEDASPAPDDSDAGDPTLSGTSNAEEDNDAGGTANDADPSTGTDGGTPVDPRRVPMFLAAGQGGRTLVSCDDGRSWIYEQIVDPTSAPDEDGGPYSVSGLIYDKGLFIGTYGHGTDHTTIRVSPDGVDWEEVIPTDTVVPEPALGIVSIDGRLYTGSTYSDNAYDWLETDPLSTGTVNIRGMTAGDGTVVAAGDAFGEVFYSDDRGENWSPAENIADAECTGNFYRLGGLSFGNGVFLLVYGNGSACRSIDGGRNWTRAPIGAEIGGQVIWTGSDFFAVSGDSGYRSPDGVDWTPVAFSPPQINAQRLAISDAGTYVTVNREGNAFYRSEDGVTWEPATAPASGNQIILLTFGQGVPSAECPLPTER